MNVTLFFSIATIPTELMTWVLLKVTLQRLELRMPLSRDERSRRCAILVGFKGYFEVYLSTIHFIKFVRSGRNKPHIYISDTGKYHFEFTFLYFS